MSNKKPPKKVGFWYGVGKGWNRVWSGVSGESSSEKRAIEKEIEQPKEELLS